ncbi:hypothetical protein CCUS01_10792 [Colletotrichum cuscutae]|uniref:Uncharacterized protein n=1 Tax=Colletotrichum cuscutae TaxID=1209917 RepID=A0AAI9XJK8_9PEZI|nr:hypothetical protein CCUS01_10792 [Colletotrichum cuscutae]
MVRDEPAKTQVVRGGRGRGGSSSRATLSRFLGPVMATLIFVVIVAAERSVDDISTSMGDREAGSSTNFSGNRRNNVWLWRRLWIPRLGWTEAAGPGDYAGGAGGWPGRLGTGSSGPAAAADAGKASGTSSGGVGAGAGGEVSENKEWWEWGGANGVSPDADADAGAGAEEDGPAGLPELLGLEIDEMEFGKCTSAECPATPDDDVVPVVLLLTDVVAGIVDDSKREKDGSIVGAIQTWRPLQLLPLFFLLLFLLHCSLYPLMYPYQTTTDVAPSVLLFLLLVSAATDGMGRALTLDWVRFVAADRQSRCNCSLRWKVNVKFKLCFRTSLSVSLPNPGNPVSCFVSSSNPKYVDRFLHNSGKFKVAHSHPNLASGDEMFVLCPACLAVYFITLSCFAKRKGHENRRTKINGDAGDSGRKRYPYRAGAAVMYVGLEPCFPTQIPCFLFFFFSYATELSPVVVPRPDSRCICRKAPSSHYWQSALASQHRAFGVSIACCRLAPRFNVVGDPLLFSTKANSSALVPGRSALLGSFVFSNIGSSYGSSCSHFEDRSGSKTGVILRFFPWLGCFTLRQDTHIGDDNWTDANTKSPGTSHEKNHTVSILALACSFYVTMPGFASAAANDYGLVGKPVEWSERESHKRLQGKHDRCPSPANVFPGPGFRRRRMIYRMPRVRRGARNRRTKETEEPSSERIGTGEGEAGRNPLDLGTGNGLLRKTPRQAHGKGREGNGAGAGPGGGKEQERCAPAYSQLHDWIEHSKVSRGKGMDRGGGGGGGGGRGGGPGGVFLFSPGTPFFWFFVPLRGFFFFLAPTKWGGGGGGGGVLRNAKDHALLCVSTLQSAEKKHMITTSTSAAVTSSEFL